MSQVDILRVSHEGQYKTAMAQIGDAATTDADDSIDPKNEETEFWQHIGFASLPSKVKEDGKNSTCAQGVIINRGGYNQVIASRDTRYNDIIGNLSDGETCLYANGERGEGQARILLKSNNSINLFTRNGPDGKGMGIFVNADGSISIASSNGGAITVDVDGNVRVFNASGAVQINTDGVKVSSTSKVSISAPAIVLGGAATSPVVNANDLTALISLITTAITGATAPPGSSGSANPASAAVFSAAASSLVSAMSASHRVAAD